MLRVKKSNDTKLWGVLAVIVATFSLFTCDVNFLQQSLDTNELDDVWTKTVEVWPNGQGQTVKSFKNGELQSFEDQYFDSNTSDGRNDIVEIHSFSARSELRWVEARSYTAQGKPSLVARYNTALALQWFSTSTWILAGSSYQPSAEYDYAANSTLEAARIYSYQADGLPTQAAEYGANATLQRLSTWSYDTSSPKRPIEHISYAVTSASPSLGASFLVAEARTTQTMSRDPSPALQAAEPRAATSSRKNPSLPAIPAVPTLTPTNPSPASPGLAVQTRKYWQYDASGGFGYSSLTLDADWYPIEMMREDSRIPALTGSGGTTGKLALSLGWTQAAPEWPQPGMKRLALKKIYFNDRLALELGVSWVSSGNGLGFPKKLSLRGDALLFPTDYEFEYDTAGLPNSLSVKSNDVLLRKLVYEYSSSGSSPVTAPSLDPLDLLSFAKNVHRIRDYDGSNQLQQSFTFAYTNNPDSSYQVSVTVRAANADGSDGAMNGSYVLEFSSAALLGSLSSYDAQGGLLWKHEYSYNDLAGDAEGLRRSAETYISSDQLSFIQNLVSGQLYQLLF